MSSSLRPHGLQHARLPCPLSPGVFSNPCPLSQWCYLTISSSATPLFFCLQSFSASGSFPMSLLSATVIQSTGVSASASVLPMNILGWFPLRLTGLISLQSKGLSRVFSSTTILKHHFFVTQPSLWSNSHICTLLLEKPLLWLIWTFVGKVVSLLFNTLSWFVITFLPKNKCLLMSWLPSLLEPKKIKSVTVSTFPPSICHKVMGLAAMILVFWLLSFQPAFHSPLSVQFCCSVVSDSLRPHESQHIRPPCPSPTPRACSHSCPLSWWCHPTISSSVVPFFSHLQSFPASGSFQMSQFFTSGVSNTTVQKHQFFGDQFSLQI